MKRRHATRWLLLGLLGSACSGASPHDAAPDLLQSSLLRNEAPSASNVATLGADNQDFAFDLYRQLATYSAGQNMLFSPYSVSSAMGMLYAGARTTTASELASTLHFRLPLADLGEAFDATDLALQSRGTGQAGADGKPFALEIANGLWVQQGAQAEQPFLDTLAVDYGAGLYTADFENHADAARETINSSVSHQTHGLVPALLPQGSLTNLTRFVLTNAVYLNAAWAQKFTSANPAPFVKQDGSSVSVPTMFLGGGMSYAQGANYQAVSLAFDATGLDFLAVLPSAGALAEVEANLSAAWLAALDASQQLRLMGLSLPKLKLESDSRLQDALLAMGFSAAGGGDGTEGQDWTGISRDAWLHISGIFHHATLEANESGTVAAAATAVVLNTHKSANGAEFVVAFDHPFLLLIRDHDTGALLFVGRVLDPSAQ